MRKMLLCLRFKTMLKIEFGQYVAINIALIWQQKNYFEIGTSPAMRKCVVASYPSLSSLLRKHRNVGKNTLLSINAYYSIRRD